MPVVSVEAVRTAAVSAFLALTIASGTPPHERLLKEYSISGTFGFGQAFGDLIPVNDGLR